MKPHHPVLLAVTVALSAGCSTPPAPAPVTAATTPADVTPASSGPAGPDAREQLLAALEKSGNTTYRFSTSGEVPDAKKITGSGTYDPKATRLSVKYQVTGGGAKTEATQRIVIGSDLYSRSKDGETWVHLDLKRIKKDSPYAYDMTDPTGLSRFVESIDEVTSTGPNAYSGTLDIEGDSFNEGFLPVGTPAVSVLFGGSATFTATTDAAGWVTSIKVALKDSDDALQMSTELSGHGKASGIKKPADVGEAMDFYYE